MSGRLAGRRILITGAASGIGLATATRFAAEGAALALLDRNGDALDSACAATGGFAALCDVGDEAAIRRAVADSAAALGGIDGVVNVAGTGKHALLEDTELADWNAVFAVNLTAPFLVMREAVRHLRAAVDATVVNVSSGQGLLPSISGLGSYCASKGGLVILGRAMALELAPIRVNTVCPGVVDTPMLYDELRHSATLPGSPYAIKRVARADELADAILYLTSRESSFVTGVALSVDGGRSYH